MLAETIAVARWRQDPIWGMQKVALDHDIANCDSATLNPLRVVLSLRGPAERVRSHELLLRYATALDRQISRSLLRLHQLQDRRSAFEPTMPSQKKLPLRNEPINPLKAKDPQAPLTPPSALPRHTNEDTNRATSPPVQIGRRPRL